MKQENIQIQVTLYIPTCIVAVFGVSNLHKSMGHFRNLVYPYVTNINQNDLKSIHKYTKYLHVTSTFENGQRRRREH
jgi:hypothetical protein